MCNGTSRDRGPGDEQYGRVEKTVKLKRNVEIVFGQTKARPDKFAFGPEGQEHVAKKTIIAAGN